MMHFCGEELSLEAGNASDAYNKALDICENWE